MAQIAHANTSTQGKMASLNCRKCGKIGHLDKWCRNYEHCGKQGHSKGKCWELHPHLKFRDLPTKPKTQESKHATKSNPPSKLLEELAKLVNSHKASMSHNQGMKSNLTTCFESWIIDSSASNHMFKDNIKAFNIESLCDEKHATIANGAEIRI
ncbi:hypothetical protein ACH5RR_039006 [Cinchona calisaya]|uniref:CCHC-type domain-containing protein n=1 Tax=Cinchona calisaya TaxID=153742 RepID=A0ABD2XYC1_9GENT